MSIYAKVLVTIVLLSGFVTACGPDLVKQSPPDQITVQLKWIHQAQFAGFYMAQDKGYYTDENINVTFVEGGPGTDPVGQAASGQADFAVDGADRVLASRGQGQPVVAIAVIFRQDPFAFITMADSGITKPVDFLGQTAAIGGGQADLQFKAMMGKLGLDSEKVTIIPNMTDYGNFYSGEADITMGYSTGGIIRIRRAGYEINLIWPADYGVHLYADTLVTTDQLVTENPDLVTRFLRATIKGWRTAVENPETAVESTLHYSADEYDDMQVEMFNAVIPLVHTGQDQIGWMRAEVWEGMHQMLLEQGILDQPLDLDTLYTMQFLEKAYQ
jgi:NitT/TauT family transport system substrate-binding protein